MTDYQKVEKLSQFPPLGAQKPSELMAAMLKLCPRGQEDSAFFTFFYLHRLPRELRVLLTEEDFTNRRALAEKADRLWAHNAKHGGEFVAAIGGDSDDEGQAGAVAAIQYRKGGNKPTPAVRSTQSMAQPRRKTNKKMSATDRQAMADSGLCYYHWCFAEAARICRKPCSWTGN